MASDNETVAEIVGDARKENGYTTPWFVCFLEDGGVDISGLLNRIEAAHRREVDKFNFDLMTIKSEQKTAANVIIEQTNKFEALKREVAELRECMKEAVDISCARCNTANGTNCDGVDTVYKACLPLKWRKVLEATKGEEDEGK